MMVFQDKSESSDDIIAHGERMRSSYHLLEHNQLALTSTLVTQTHWKSPPHGVLKVNVDAIIIATKDFFDVGIVGLDHSGLVHFAE